MRETGAIALMPSNLRFDQAVVCEGAYYAHPIIEHFALKPGDTILIYGASGAIGTAALQLAKDRGAGVVAVVHGRHRELMRSLRADRVIDYTTDEFDQLGRTFRLRAGRGGQAGRIAAGGNCSGAGAFSRQRISGPARNTRRSCSGRDDAQWPLRGCRWRSGGSGQEFVNALREKIEAGRFVPVIDRRYPLAAIADAYRYVQTGEKAGVVVIDVATEGTRA
jgi:NADPH:quinone reductase-like Zn-dependent oxidoreductase